MMTMMMIMTILTTLMTLISTTDEERRVDERDGLKKSLRLKYVDVEVKWSCRGLYPSKGPEGLSYSNPVAILEII